jgi:hypothetical protein
MDGVQALLILGALICVCFAFWADRKHQRKVQAEIDALAPHAHGTSDDWDGFPR